MDILHLAKIVAAELQWVRGPITAVMPSCSTATAGAKLASMGPRSDNRGYENRCASCHLNQAASMGPRSDNRGYAVVTINKGRPDEASMGPRSDNRGYVGPCRLLGQKANSFNGSAVR